MRLYRGSSGNWVHVDEACVLGAGGEGRVYGVTGAPNLAAKIFDDGGRPDREEKLQTMLANAPARLTAGGHTSIAWPEDLLSEAPGAAAIGYLMARVSNGRVIDDYYNPQARLEHCPLFHYEYLLVVARNLASAVRSLHQRGYVIGDVKQSNILVTPNALVTLVDTDSFQVRSEENGRVYRCPVGTPEYTPPELQGLAAPGLLVPEHDLFGLAALIFQLLMEGSHPFAGAYTGEDDPPPIGDRIQKGWFPYDRSALATLNGATFKRQVDLFAPPFVPARKALPFTVLPPEIQDYFVRCFVFGHHDASQRPTAENWLKALDRARKALVRCSANGQHRYPSHLADCPWCDRARTVLRGHDPFPAHATPVVGYDAPPAPAFPGRPPFVPPLEPPPLPSYVPRRTGQTKSGWAAYAIAALGLPIFLGLLSSHEVHEPIRPDFEVRQLHDNDQPTTAPDAPTLGPTTMSVAPTDPSVGSTGSLALAGAASGQDTLTSDGRFAAILTAPMKASLIECRTGRILGGLEVDDAGGAIETIAVAPSGMLMAAANRNGITVWDRGNGTSRYLQNHFAVKAIAFSPDSKLMAVADSQSQSHVVLIDVQFGDSARGFASPDGASVASLSFSPDGHKLYGMTEATGDKPVALSCWEVATGNSMWRISGLSWNTHFAVSPNSQVLAVGGSDLEQRDAVNGEPWIGKVGTGGLYMGVTPLCYAQDGSLLAVTDGTSLCVSRSEGKGKDYFDLLVGQVTSAAFSSDGTRLTTLSTTNGLEVWDIHTKRRLRRIALPSH